MGRIARRSSDNVIAVSNCYHITIRLIAMGAEGPGRQQAQVLTSLTGVMRVIWNTARY